MTTENEKELVELDIEVTPELRELLIEALILNPGMSINDLIKEALEHFFKDIKE